MGLITPDYGLLFWMLLSFGVLMFLLKKFAWKPILHGIKSREEMISKALHEAEMARTDISKLEERSAEIINKAQSDSEAILLDAKKTKERIIEEASLKAQQDAQKFLDQAREILKREKEVAQLEIKVYASKIILDATERILRRELKDKNKYEEQINLVIQELSAKN
jgi:F-type H+-transporting ATPase subunit b